MTLPDVAFIIGLILAAIEEARTRAQSLLGWAVIAVCIGLLWHAIGS